MCDQCKHCQCVGDIDLCHATPCYHRESWWAKKMLEENAIMREALEYIKRVVPSGSITKVDIYKVAREALQRVGGGK